MENNKQKKKSYIPPKIELTYILEIESAIAASSVTLSPGGSTNTPVVTDWEEKKVEENWNF